MVELGNHQANLEGQLDPQTGTLTLWVWDAHIDNLVRLSDPWLEASVTVSEVTFNLACNATASSLTGETVGNSATFVGQDDRLIGGAHVDVHVPVVTVFGEAFKDTYFHLPPH